MMTCYMYFQKLFLTNTQEYVLFVQFIVGMFCFTKLSKDTIFFYFFFKYLKKKSKVNEFVI